MGEGKASGSFGMPSGGGNRRLASEQFAVSDTLLIMNGLELRRLHSLSHENVKNGTRKGGNLLEKTEIALVA